MGGAGVPLEEPLLVEPHVPAGTTEITLSPLEWQIAVGADGQRSIRDLSQELGTSDFAIATALLAMSNASLLGLNGTDEVPSDELEPEIEDAADQTSGASDFAYD